MSNPTETVIPIEVMVGNETTRNSSAALYLFWMPRDDQQMPKREIGMDSAIRFMPTMRRNHQKVMNATLDRPRDIGGAWTEAHYTVPDKTALKLWGEKTGWGVVAAKAALVLFCSKDAPVSRVTMKLCGLPTCSKHEVTMIGQFWVLDRDSVADFPDVPQLTPVTEKFSSPVFVKETFKIETLIPAPEKAVAQIANTTTVNTGTTIVAAGTHAGGSVTLTTKKARRVLG